MGRENCSPTDGQKNSIRQKRTGFEDVWSPRNVRKGTTEKEDPIGTGDHLRENTRRGHFVGKSNQRKSQKATEGGQRSRQ